MMLLTQSFSFLLLLCAAAQLWGRPGLVTSLEEMGTPPEKLRVPLELGLSTQVPFEVNMVNERFQAEATCWEPSTLDSSHHQVVVVHYSHCASQNEEEVAAKLVVAVSNCQATVEAHQTHPSSPYMEQPSGRLRLGLETPSLLWPALDETLIAAGQRHVVQLIEDITQRMGNASGHGTLRLQEGHRANLSMQERVRDVYSQLESNLALLLAQQHQMEEVMEKLWQMNQSLGLALVAVEDARNQVEKHLRHLQCVQDPTGQSPSVISACILHGSYFALLVLLLVPTLPRAILLLFLFLTSSVLAELLGISALFALLVLAVTGKWLFVTTCCGAGGSCLVVPPEKPRTWFTSTPEREHELELLQVELDKMEMSYLEGRAVSASYVRCAPSQGVSVQHLVTAVLAVSPPVLMKFSKAKSNVLHLEPSCLKQPSAVAGEVPNIVGRVSSICGGWRTKLSCGEMLDMATGTEKPKPYSPSRSLTSNVSLRSQCQGLTRAGQPCRKKAVPGQDFCYVHTTS